MFSKEVLTTFVSRGAMISRALSHFRNNQLQKATYRQAKTMLMQGSGSASKHVIETKTPLTVEDNRLSVFPSLEE
jgi:hypothetical protein